MSPRRISKAPVCLGPVDGFDQDEPAGKCNERDVILSGLLAAEGDTLEAFELADRLLDPAPPLIQDAREEGGSPLGIGAVRNHWADAALACRLPVRLSIVALVGPDISYGCQARQGYVLCQLHGGFVHKRVLVASIPYQVFAGRMLGML